MYTWRTDTNGMIVVSDDGGPEFIPTLTGKLAERCDHGIAGWGDKFRAWGLGVRWEWLISMGLQESNFNPRAVNPERLPGPEDDGIGMFQLTAKGFKVGHTDEQLKDPQLNTTIASKHILSLSKLYGWDFPKVSAAYNAGSVHKPYKGFENKWNLHCWHGHLDVEVPALNYTIGRGLADYERLKIDDANAVAAQAFARRFGILDLYKPPSAIESEGVLPPDRNS